jgi:uncharacterized DUF497 family protein
MRILGFDWDKVNINKLRVHGLEKDDVEDLFDEGPVVVRHPGRGRRRIALGFLPKPDDRFVLVSFELDEETQWVRVVTAFEPTGDKWWRIYAKAKGIKG